jgi:hypothetical protein
MSVPHLLTVIPATHRTTAGDPRQENEVSYHQIEGASVSLLRIRETCFDAGKYRANSMEAAGFPPGGRQIRRRTPVKRSTLISKPVWEKRDISAHQTCTNFVPVRKISIRQGNLYKQWRFSWEIAIFCTNLVISPGIVDFLAFCKF